MKQVVRGAVLVLVLLVPTVIFAAENKVFTQLDADKNGTVSKDELLKADLHLVATPKGQQVVTRDMVKAGTAAAMTEEQKKSLFDQIDTDKSGQISKKEWSRASRDGLILLKF